MINLIELKKLSFVAHQKLEDIMLSSFQSRMISNTKKISFVSFFWSDPLYVSICEQVSNEIISLPMNPYVSDDKIGYISKGLK